MQWIKPRLQDMAYKIHEVSAVWWRQALEQVTAVSNTNVFLSTLVDITSKDRFEMLAGYPGVFKGFANISNLD